MSKPTYTSRIKALRGVAETEEAWRLYREWVSASRMVDGGVEERNEHWTKEAEKRRKELDDYLKEYE